MQQEKFTAGIFLDLSKAFDSLEHEAIFKKMERYGLRGNCLQWFKSYLYNRKLLVSCRTSSSTQISNSNLYDVEYGTAQGSCLGPLIFLIFCNDLYMHLLFLECIQFADDTTLYITHSNIDYIRFCIDHDLNTLQDWFLSNKLTLNVSKSVCILFGKQKNTPLNIRLGGEEIPQVKDTKFLGMWIDEELNWNTHVSHLILKLKAKLNLLRAGKNMLGKHALKVVYYAQIHSHISYGLGMWGCHLSQAKMEKLQKIQNECIEMIGRGRSPTEHNILTISQQIQLELCKIWHKKQLKILPKKLMET